MFELAYELSILLILMKLKSISIFVFGGFFRLCLFLFLPFKTENRTRQFFGPNLKVLAWGRAWGEGIKGYSVILETGGFPGNSGEVNDEH